MRPKPPADVGYEYRKHFTSSLSPEQESALKMFGASRGELIRSNQWHCESPWYVPHRTLNNDFMVFALRGGIEVDIMGNKRVLRRGDFSYAAPGESHAFGLTGDLDEVEHILLHYRILLPGYHLKHCLFGRSFHTLPDPEPFLSQLQDLSYLVDVLPEAANGMANALVRGLLMDLVLKERLDIPVFSAMDPRLSAAIAYMNKHFRSDLQVDALAKVADLSEVHFRRIFREVTGLTPVDFLIGLRLQEACTLLSESQRRIKDIARSCGFNDVDYFCRIFRRKLDCTPSSYRKTAQIM